jgi:threonine synthase
MRDMETEIIKNRVGKTPLIRAYNLEVELGISKIYLKLEGNNPSGHREDRLAYLIIKDALVHDHDTICLGTYGTVGGSLSYLSQFFGVNCVFFVPNMKKIMRKKLLLTPNVKIIEHGKTYEQCVEKSRQAAEENGWYNANPGLENNIMNMYAFSYLSKEITNQMSDPIDTVFCQTSNGSSISGLHLGLKQLWIDEQIERLPKIYAVATSHGNAIIESYRRNSREILTLDSKDIKESRYNRNLINIQCFGGQDALNAIYDTNGKAIGISDDELLEYGRMFKKKERIKLTALNAFPIAAFIKEVKENNIKKGRHVIILNDGKVSLDIRRMSKEDLNVRFDQFLRTLDDWLIRFSDPIDEIREAVENAFEHGFILCAYQHNSIVGIAVISKTRFQTFFPKYHLSYIATKKNIKGKGIATQLLQKAIEVSNGDISLHVEVENKRAIKLYEKMGLRKKYYRMLYKGEVSPNGNQNK